MPTNTLIVTKLLCALALLALFGCAHPVNDLLADIEPLAPERIRKIQVEVLVGDDPELQTYTPETITQRLKQINQIYQDQAVPLILNDPSSVEVAPQWNEVNSYEMARLRAKPYTLLLVITKSIKNCGQAYAHVVGCTPRIGQPVVFVSAAATKYVAPEAVIWAHEIGHAAGLEHAQEESRLMSYKPTSEAVKFSPQERQKMTQLARNSSARNKGGLQAALRSDEQTPDWQSSPVQSVK